MSWKERASRIEEPQPNRSSWKERATSVEGGDEDPSKSAVTAGTTGLLQGMTGGFADEIGAAGKTAMDAITGIRGPLAGKDLSDLSEDYRSTRDALRRDAETAKEANPLVSTGGNVAGTIATLGMTGLGGAATTAEGSFGLGAAQGLGESRADLTRGEVGQAAEDALKSGVTNAALQVASEKLVGPALKKAGEFAGEKLSPVGSYLKNKFNKGLSKGAKFAAGVDDEAALRQLERPLETAAAQGDDFVYDLGKKAARQVQNKGSELGKRVGRAEEEFVYEYGNQYFPQASALAEKVDSFLQANKPSKAGFSAISDSQREELAQLAQALKPEKHLTGEDLIKLRKYLDHVEKLAGKYDQEGTSPFVNFLKSLRHDADTIVDQADPQGMDAANRAFAAFKDDQSILRGVGNESTSEGFIGNLYGANKTAKQKAAERVLAPKTLEEARDVAANKSFEKVGPAGSEYGLRNMIKVGSAIPTLGLGPLAMSPRVWKESLRLVGKLQQSDPGALGKFAKPLRDAALRGAASLEATHALLSRDPEYREMLERASEQ